MRSPRHLATPGNTVIYGAACVGGEQEVGDEGGEGGDIGLGYE